MFEKFYFKYMCILPVNPHTAALVLLTWVSWKFYAHYLCMKLKEQW